MTDQSTETTYYDVLGVPRDAKPAQIRRAWRRLSDKAGPGSPELARYNEAAEILLDPVKRAAYDVEHPAPAPEPAEEPEGAETTPGSSPRWLQLLAFVVLPILTVGAIVLAVVFTLQHHRDTQTADARDEAPAAAEQALKYVLAYDYRHLADDRTRAGKYLTPAYKKKFLETFALLEQGKGGRPGSAVQTKTVVTADVVGTAVMDAEPDRAHVLAYVNQTSRHGSGDPMLFQNRVRVSLVHRDGAWLIDGLDPR